MPGPETRTDADEALRIANRQVSLALTKLADANKEIERLRLAVSLSLCPTTQMDVAGCLATQCTLDYCPARSALERPQ